MHKYMYVETNISNMWTEILVRSVRNASLEKECKRLSRWIKFGWCNGAMFSQWSQPGSHSLLIVSTPTHEADGCVCVLPNEGQTRRNTQRRRINMHTPFAATPVSKMMFSLFPNMCLLSQPVDSAGKGIPSTSFLCSLCVFFPSCQVTMADRSAADRACKDPNPIIDGRKANVNLAYLGAKPRVMQPGKDNQMKINTVQKIYMYIYLFSSTSHRNILVLYDKIDMTKYGCLGVRGWFCWQSSKQENQVNPWFSPQGSLVF